MATPRIDYRYKIIVLGESDVGKTCLLHKYKEDDFKQSLMTTIGVDTVSKNIVLNGKNVMLNIWDTAGQERFFSITKSYYRNADGILLIFDISDERTFSCVDRWFGRIREETGNVPLFLVGNKRDKVDSTTYYEMESRFKSKADEMKAQYYTTSAKTGENVNNIFEDMAMILLKKQASGQKWEAGSLCNSPASGINRKINRRCC
ncbi:Rab GTPase [Encephalitozoon hellem ATCC 50504]|uniref:GTP-binding nuclear protein Ran n=1 Tax=Encephalitozoon hellem TaxID=27973 RepID=A0A9Q9F8T9_ENCHE|nr:Rab GTPase [Encephalitozoon hellem ATCC 50504]AFM99016.1 Rab GTPase [Encephalitozoon hellem ATCC 50504]UTX44034.1 GTP-binding nuclear protein Ran [Encephalitozoon hellem]WEL39517.1 Ras-related protein Rab [Encephalitozoon hellem]|eukprot:XP_003887997.1 Rab GTPase [Encephalitozoon hellem ATCC 50504]